ncbi:50S ribosomal protein L25 [Suicoccus acidiformans]|uniref:Large ribosomal subunit protein bL25 n=1 Tax=Suicoccus acidiformans TaxID=2036206 RepID=A0A347WLP3_9LACT|nr:50S ribosomal protein L25 [Suicoccus acidiformans]AXY26000.1 50S ribosomal protein L25 [Suicoccus acidiformans]
MSLKAEVRMQTGTSASKRDRREGKIPVSLYGKDHKAQSLLIDRREFEQILRSEGANAVFDVEVEGQTQKVWIKDFEQAALQDIIYSVDLEAISANQTLEVEVPLYLVNEAAVKVGVVELVENTIMVETKPDSIPQSFELDVAELEIGDVLTVADLDVPADVTVIMEEDTTIVTVSAPTEEPEEVDPDAEMAEPEVIGESDEEE